MKNNQINTNDISDVVIGIDAIAHYLRISRATCAKALKNNEIPARQLGDRGRWLASRTVLRDWLSGNKNEVIRSLEPTKRGPGRPTKLPSAPSLRG